MLSPELPNPLRGRVFRGSDAVARGLLTRHALATPVARRLFRDCYADPSLRVDHALRCRALALVLPDRAVFAGWSAAALADIDVVDPWADVLVRVPHASTWGPMSGVRPLRRRAPLLTTRVADLPIEAPGEVLFTVAGLPGWARTRPGDHEPRPDLVEALVLVDAVLGRWPVLGRDVPSLLAGWSGRRGVQRARTVVGLADGRSESPMESRLRVLLTFAGLTPPSVQHVVRGSAGEFIARVDLAWPRRRVAVEYDGRVHDSGDRRFRADRDRLNRLAAARWTVVHVTSDLLRDGVGPTVAALRPLLAD